MACQYCRVTFHLEKVEVDAHYSQEGLRIGLNSFDQNLMRKALKGEGLEEDKKFEAVICLDEKGQKCLLIKNVKTL